LAGPDVQRDAKYKPAEVCRLADVQPYVLRYWESEFPFLVPNRNAQGPRSYSDNDLQLIRRIKQLLYDEGYTIAGAKKRLESELKKGVLLFDDAELGEPESVEVAETENPSTETDVAPFDPDDTGAGSPAPPKPKRKPKAIFQPPPPAPEAVAEHGPQPDSDTQPLHRAVPPPLPASAKAAPDPRLQEAVAELKELLAILKQD
jgi:DNA-binding transcriptional MerR regulator